MLFYGVRGYSVPNLFLDLFLAFLLGQSRRLRNEKRYLRERNRGNCTLLSKQRIFFEEDPEPKKILPNLRPHRVVDQLAAGVALSLRYFSGGIGSNPQKTQKYGYLWRPFAQ
jgi:hypothetical protein